MEKIILTAGELAERLMEHPDFKVEFCFCDKDNSEFGMTARTFSVDIEDVSHSDKIIMLGGKEGLQ